MLFLLSFSLFLHVEVKQQIDRKRFLWLQENSSNTTALCHDQTENCLFFKLEKEPKTNYNCDKMINKSHIPASFEKLCQKDPEFLSDSSRMVFAAIIFFFVCFLLVKGFWVSKDYCLRAEDKKKYRKSTFLSRFLTLVAAFVGIIVVAIAIAADSKSITLKPTQPFFDLDDGLVLLHWALVISVVYFSGVMFLKARCFRIFEDKMIIATLTEPHTMMQILTLGPALLSVIWKNELMSTHNNGIITGLTSISIAMAAGVLVIQIGSDGETYFGQFATMFHLTLKKIPAHVFAVIYLLHGFSFGFWLLENRLATADVGIKENKTVRYCTLPFCASAVKDRAQVTSMQEQLLQTAKGRRQLAREKEKVPTYGAAL